VHLWRGNSFTDIHGAPDWFLSNLRRHLSIPISGDTKTGERFGSKFMYHGEFYGSLVNGNRVTSGLTWHVEQLAKYYCNQGYHVPCEVFDRRKRPGDQYPLFSVRAKWRPYQDIIHKVVMREGVGVVDAPPRSGKTLMAARAIDTLAVPTLYIAPTVAIVRQTFDILLSYFGNDMVARLDGTAHPSEKDISKMIVVATAPSALKQAKEFYDTRELLIIDEFHHAAAETYHAINKLAENIYYRLCFTGTHWRTGGDRLAMEAICSLVLHRLEIADLIPEYLVQPFIYYIPFRGRPIRAQDWMEAYMGGIVENEERNIMVANVAKQMLDNNIPTIVLVKRRAHADYLGEIIPDSVVAKGGEGILTSNTIKKYLGGEFFCLIGTSVIGEGVDLPNAAALIYASGGGDSVHLMQSYFRPFTAHPSKQWGRVYDFYDLHHPTLQRHAQDRIACARRFLGNCVYTPE
jgi:superfamily II DNA or RNA helicase